MLGLGPVSSQPQAASMLAAGFSGQQNNEPSSFDLSLHPLSLRLQLRCQERILGPQIMGQDTE